MYDLEPRYVWSEHRKALTNFETGIRALKLFGICCSNHADKPISEHFHRNCMEITFQLKGYQIYHVGEESFNLAGSDILVTYPNEPHSTGNAPEGNSHLIWMQIDLSEEIPFFGLDRENANFLRSALLNLPRLFRGDPELERDFSSAFYLMAEKNALDRFLGKEKFLCALLRMIRLSKAGAEDNLKYTGNAIDYIRSSLSEEITLEELAQCCSLSLPYFKVKFREETGTTPRDFINREKIEKAKEFLKEGMRITDVASRLGFTTSNYFSVQFKRYTGKTPREYIYSLKRK